MWLGGNVSLTYIIIGGALSNGGNLVRWLQETLNLGRRKAVLQQVAQLPPDGHGLTFLARIVKR